MREIANSLEADSESNSLRWLYPAILGMAIFLVTLPGWAAEAVEDSSERQELLEKGAYIARAGNCLSCHGEDLAGGYELKTPLGEIVATNISPSIEFGIGKYTAEQFSRAIREGIAPGHRLYPAMPYASYVGMSDADVTALYHWVMSQPPVDEVPEEQTDLPFPFNIRMSMLIWNALFLDESTRFTEDRTHTERGAYLVNHLGHCGECHTPRNAMYGPDEERYLAGAIVDGWLAPNITGDRIGGIGAWTDQALVDYLDIGYADDVAQAAGSMTKVVHHGTHFMDPEDRRAIASYLKRVTPVRDPGQPRSAFLAPEQRSDPEHAFGQIREEMSTALARDDLSSVESMYLRECAACHGVSGQGQPEAYYPPLVDNVELRRADPTNVVQSIANGIEAGSLYRSPGMPGFGAILAPAEIAALANHLRVTFGGMAESALTERDVNEILDGKAETPWLIRLAPLLAWLALLVLALLIGFILYKFHVRQRRASDKRAEAAS